MPLRSHADKRSDTAQRARGRQYSERTTAYGGNRRWHSQLVQIQQRIGNRAMSQLLVQRNESEEEARFAELQRSMLYERDPDMSSQRNYLIDQYEALVRQAPEDYTGNIYSEVLPPSTTQANYSAAAGHTARDPINNRTRWALQNSLLQYGIVHGYDQMVERAETSTEFSYQIHLAAFQFANGAETIGRMPWALLTHINVPAMGEALGEVIFYPRAFAAGLEAGLTQLAMNPYNQAGANAAFNRAFNLEMSRKYDLGGEIINWTIETTNSPHGPEALPWYGRVLRGGLDVLSWMTYPLYD